MRTTLSDEDIQFVSQLVREAGFVARDMREGVEIKEKSGPQDKVTAADHELSRIIVTALSERFANDIVVSEEDAVHATASNEDRLWLVDPIDGTDNYILNDGQYCVMVGLLENSKPVFGWVFAPATDITYFGGIGYGAWSISGTEEPKQFETLPRLEYESDARLIMGFRDRKSHPWVTDLPKVKLIKSGSIGLKVAKILEGHADLYAHLGGKLKTWDTAGPSAIAIAGGLDVGGLEQDSLAFPLTSVFHECSIIIGRPGSLNWSRKYLKQPVQEAKS